jgi:hypothetical protein
LPTAGHLLWTFRGTGQIAPGHSPAVGLNS